MAFNVFRDWAGPCTVEDEWKNAGFLARHRPYIYYNDEKVFPTDDHGFRIPSGHASVRAQYEAAPAGRRVACLGGSTTFGTYLPCDEAYPAQLGALSGAVSLNFGLQAMDLYGSYLAFADLLREGLVPDVAVFVDGANEVGTYRQFIRGDAEPSAEFCQYRAFLDFISAANLKHRLRTLVPYVLSRIGARQSVAVKAADESALPRFAAAQVTHYLTSKRAIEKLAGAYGVRTLFLLQPSIWHYWDNHDDTRFRYIDMVYGGIRDQDGDVVDISADCRLVPEMFFDTFHLTGEGYGRLAERIAEVGSL